MTNKTFINPYHFVPMMAEPIGSKCSEKVIQTLVRKPETGEAFQPEVPEMLHDRYSKAPEDQSSEEPVSATPTYSGRIICTLTTRSPCVFGNLHRKVRLPKESETDKTQYTTIVDNFEIDGRAAIAGTSLKGMLSTLAEMASGSAMRVLQNRAMSIRSQMTQSRSAMGVIIERNGERSLLPLTLPTFKRNQNKSGYVPTDGSTNELWDELRRLRDDYVKASEIEKWGWTALYVQPTSDNTQEFTYYPSHQVVEVECPSFTEIKWDSINHRPAEVQDSQLINRRDVLRPFKKGSAPEHKNWKMHELPEIAQLQAKPKPGHLQGICRNLVRPPKNSGLASSSYALFIPLPDFMVDRSKKRANWPRAPHDNAFEKLLLSAESACRVFDVMTTDPRSTTPDDPAATPWCNQPKFKHSEQMSRQLRHGDIVYFRPSNDFTVESAAISSIWREGFRWLWKDKHDHMLANYEQRPMDLKRVGVSIAEGMFGWVMDNGDSSDEHEKSPDGENVPERKKSGLPTAYRGRIRISDAISEKKLTEVQMAPYEKTSKDWADRSKYLSQVVGYYPLKILSSPKLPCPEMYFKIESSGSPKHANASNARESMMSDSSEKRRSVKMQGWKFYVINRRTLDSLDSRTWTTNNRNENDTDLHQKVWVHPIKVQAEFTFHIDFEQLTQVELAVLCYSLSPAGGSALFFHRLGLGKPLGLGIVEITPKAILYINREARYRQNENLLTRANRYSNYPESNASELEGTQDIMGRACHLHGAPSRTDEPTSNLAKHLSIEEWAHQHRNLLDQEGSQHKCILAMGTPPKLPEGCLGVSYPVQDNQDGESKLYEWFVTNRDRKKTKHIKTLEPMQTDDGEVKGPRPPEVRWRFALSFNIPDDLKATIVDIIKAVAREYGHRVVIAEVSPPDEGPLIPTSGDYDWHFGFPGIKDATSCNFTIRDEQQIDEQELRQWLLKRLGRGMAEKQGEGWE